MNTKTNNKHMIYKIKNIEIQKLLGTNTPHTLLIAVEKHPHVDYKVKPTDRPCLWYQMPSEHQSDTYDAYHREKLAVTDPIEAQRLRTDFNTALANNSATPLVFNYIFVHKGYRRGIPYHIGYGIVIRDEDVLVFTSKRHHDDSNATGQGPGQGGYLWQRLPRSKHITHEMLNERLGMRTKWERDWFIKEWGKVI